MFKGIMSIVLLITAVGTFFMLIKPLYAEVGSLSAQKTSFEEALSNTKQIQETRDKLLSQYNNVSRESIDRLNKIIPSQPGSMEFILEMQNIAQKNGMTLKKIDVRDAETSGKVGFEAEGNLWETVPFSAKLSGTYKSFYLFARDAEKNLRLTDINSISFSSGETDFYEFIIEGSFYWKK